MMASATTQTAIEKASNAPHGPSRSEREIKGRQHYPTTVDGATVLVAENGATDLDLLMALTLPRRTLQLSEPTDSDVIDGCAFSTAECLDASDKELTGRLYLAERPTALTIVPGDDPAEVADA